MSKLWPTAKLSDIAPITRRPVEVDASASYPELGIRSFGRGTFHKPPLSGLNVGSKKMFQIEPGDLVFSNVFAWEGAVAVATKDDFGRYGSHRFITCSVDATRADARYLCQYLVTSAGLEKLQRASPGGAGRNRTLGLEKLGDIEIPLPPVLEQRRIVERIENVRRQLQLTDALRESIDHEIASLLAVRFQETLKQADWFPMRDVAPLIRRKVAVIPEVTYSELGIRSFFKGAFIRRTVSGSEFTWQKLYEVNTDDLIFSNIMAWEKAIALAEPEHDICVGNHRMLTCEAKIEKSLPQYLSYYFTTEDGFSKVYAASLGTAARNRTLTTDSLMAITVPVPPIQVQRQFVKLQVVLNNLAKTRAEQERLANAILPSLTQQTLSSEI